MNAMCRKLHFSVRSKKVEVIEIFLENLWIQAILSSRLVQPNARLSPLIPDKQERLSACRRFTETAERRVERDCIELWLVKETAHLLVRVSNVGVESLRLQFMEWSHLKGKISMHMGDLKVKFYQGSISSMDNAYLRK
uniref:Uncharacterized protein n=1 Tax=Magallana gigas TaxID=29159 RepID=K1QQ71_MAGGI